MFVTIQFKMFFKFISNANRDSSATVLYVTLIGAFPLTLTFLLWNIYLFNRIKQNLKLYKKALNEPMYNKESQMYEYKTNYIKYWYMLLINCSEFFGTFYYIIGFVITEFLWTHHERFQYPNRFRFSNCSLDLYHNLPSELVTEVPVGLFFVASAQSSILFGMALGVCLMKYLESRYHNVKEPRGWIIRFIQFTCLIAFSFLIVGSIPQTVILHRIFEPLIQLVYYYKWVKQARRFYQVSLSKAFEYRLTNRKQFNSNLKFAYQFKLVTFSNSIGLGCLFFAELLAYFLFLISTILCYAPCLFHYLYGTRLFQSILHTPLELTKYKEAIFTASMISKLFVLVSFVALTGQYFIASLVFLVRILRPKIKSRFGKGVRMRYTPSISHPLLFKHQVKNENF